MRSSIARGFKNVGVSTFVLLVSCPILATAAEKSQAEHQDMWAYEQIVHAYNTTYAMRKKGNTPSEFESTLSALQEMALIQLDRSNSGAASKALAYLNLLKLDGVVSEDQGCAVLRKGKAILGDLSAAKSALASGHCVMQGVSVKPDPQICAERKDAERKIDQQILGIRKGEKCER